MVFLTTTAMIFSSSLFSLTLCQSLIVNSFKTSDETMCDVNDRINRGCSRQVTTTRSFVHCVSLCGRDETCVGVSRDDTGKCFLHQECPEITTCTVQFPNHRHMTKAKACVHGTWDFVSQSCTCTGLFHGDMCEKYPINCGALIRPGHSFGLHQIVIDPLQDGETLLDVLCRTRDPDHHNIIMLRNIGVIDFNRTWEDYKSGFFINEDSMWGGLDAWHILTNAGCDKLIMIIHLTGSRKVQRTYFKFRMANEEAGYSFTFESAKSDKKGALPDSSYFGNCLDPLQNKPFSAWDHDNDGDGLENCASRAGSGWWYSGCNNPCNFLGYGLNYWTTKPSHQLFSVEGFDMDPFVADVEFFAIFLRCL